MHLIRKIALVLLGLGVLITVFSAEGFRSAGSQVQALALLDTTPDWLRTGDSAGDTFGSAFASGDVNGDGYADLITGAPGYNTGSGQGAVYIDYGGSSGFDTPALPRQTLEGDAGYPGYFGSAVACADVDGDGYDDIIVGEPGFTNSTGRVYVYLGSGAGLNPARALTLNGQTTNNQFGFSVASAGDVNGDGYADFVVGAPKYNSDVGRAYFHLGGASLSTTPAMTLTVLGQPGRFGALVAPAGDINGDGYTDLVVGAPDFNGYQGRAFVFLGTSAGLGATPAVTLTGQTSANYFGQSGGMAGDVNGDGYGDLMLGARGYNSNQGRAYLYLGSQAGLTAAPALTLTGQAGATYFGRSIGWAGDANGDGYADVMIGADGYASGFGGAFLYLGGQAGLQATPAITLTGAMAASGFGGSVGGAGDANGDGYADMAVGAAKYWSDRGAISVFYGTAFLPSDVPHGVITGQAGSRLGASVTTAGDVNGDGLTDVLVGAKGEAGNRGAAYLYLGDKSGLGLTPALTLTGESAGDLFAAAVGSAGDVNGDGYADILIGAEGYGSGRGRAYLYLGTAEGLQATPALTLTGSLGDQLGASVGTAGDVNGDGYADFVVGAPGASRVFVFHGGTSLRAAPALSLAGENSPDLFGLSSGSAGDMNGDGYADVIVGASGYNASRGRAYLYLGSGEGLGATPALTLTLAGGNSGDYFGASVGSAGDVNGDGFADLAVGAYGAGQVSVYAGSATPEATPMIVLTSGRSGDHFGIATGTAGDVNGDGYSDLIAGAEADTSGQGRAYVYLGGPAGIEAGPAITLTGESTGSAFGSAAGTAGDVDGDGYADLLVGAYGFDGYQGRVYLFLGNGGGGKAGLAQAERPNDGLPVPPWGLSRLTDGFQVSVAAADPHGRGRVKLQAEVCLPGTAFADPGCRVQTSAAWMDVAASPTLSLTVTDLAPNTVYRWRARTLYAPYSVNDGNAPPNPVHGPWRRFLGQSQEADVHTARWYWIHLPLVVR